MNSNTDNSTTDSEGWNSVTKNTKKSKKSEDKSKLIETSEKKLSTYSSIVKGNSTTTSDKQVSTSDKQVSTSDKQVSTSEKEVTTTEKEVSTPEKEVSTPEKEVSTPEKEVSTPEKEVSTAKKEVSTPEKEVSTPEKEVTNLDKEKDSDELSIDSDSSSNSSSPNTSINNPNTKPKRFAKSSAPINVKVNFTKRDNPKNNLRDNNIEYKKALIIASHAFFNECLLNNKDFIEKEKIKISKFYNYKNTVHKVSYAKDFDSQKIGTQTIAFSRSHFAHNETFIKKLISEYKNIFPECDWVKIRDSTRDDEPDTLIISIGRTIKLKN
jgi:hypothetical protein